VWVLGDQKQRISTSNQQASEKFKMLRRSQHERKGSTVRVSAVRSFDELTTGSTSRTRYSSSPDPLPSLRPNRLNCHALSFLNDRDGKENDHRSFCLHGATFHGKYIAPRLRSPVQERKNNLLLLREFRKAGAWLHNLSRRILNLEEGLNFNWHITRATLMTRSFRA
jgi:hypothetical protein